MNRLKRILLIMVIIFIGVINILIYINLHLYYKSINLEETGTKIELLEKANHFYPLNDLAHHELGKAYFELAEININVKDTSISYLDRSIESFQRSIRINPSSQFSHIHLGKSLVYKDLLSPSKNPNFLEEYKKAAELVNHYNEIYYEVSKLYLSRWAELSDEDKSFTLAMLREIWAGMNREKILSLLQIWEMNIKDYAIMSLVLPDIPEAYKLYADFLGERSLDLLERQRLLAVYEKLEVERAREAFNLGENFFYYHRLEEALDQFQRCLRALKQIHFYQNLTSDNLINEHEITTLRNSTFLNLAKCQIEAGKDWSEIEGNLLEYLQNEDSVSAINNLET